MSHTKSNSDGSKAKTERSQFIKISVPENFELGDQMKRFVYQSFRSKTGKVPIEPETKAAGTYHFPDTKDNKDEIHISFFKPNSEHSIPKPEKKEKKLQPKRSDGMTFSFDGTRAGGGAPREFAAYLLDHPKGRKRTGLQYNDTAMGFAGVPPTLLVTCINPDFNLSKKELQEANYEYKLENNKVGSLHMYIEDHNCKQLTESDIPNIPDEEVHKISLLDIRYANVKRHASNILCHKDEDGKISIVPIDHGYCFPQRFATSEFEWMKWEKAKKPFSLEFKEYIGELDAQKDIDLLKKFGIEMSSKSERTFRMSTMLLKHGVEKELTPFQIGNIMCRKTKHHSISDIEGIANKTFNDLVYEAMDDERHIDHKTMDSETPKTEVIRALEHEFRKKVSPIIRNELSRSSNEEQK